MPSNDELELNSALSRCRTKFTVRQPQDPIPGNGFLDYCETFCGGDKSVIEALSARVRNLNLYQFLWKDQPLDGSTRSGAALIEFILLWIHEAKVHGKLHRHNVLYDLVRRLDKNVDATDASLSGLLVPCSNYEIGDAGDLAEDGIRLAADDCWATISTANLPNPLPGNQFLAYCNGDSALIEELSARVRNSDFYRFFWDDQPLYGSTRSDAALIEFILIWTYAAKSSGGNLPSSHTLSRLAERLHAYDSSKDMSLSEFLGRNLLEDLDENDLFDGADHWDEETEKAGAQAQQEPTANGKMSRKDANDKAMELAKADKDFVMKSQRKWAKDIGCSPALVGNLPLWKATQELRKRGKAAKSPGTVSLTPKIEATHGVGDRDEVLNHLIAEQEAEDEGSPLDANSSDRPRKARGRRKL